MFLGKIPGSTKIVTPDTVNIFSIFNVTQVPCRSTPLGFDTCQPGVAPAVHQVDAPCGAPFVAPPDLVSPERDLSVVTRPGIAIWMSHGPTDPPLSVVA